MRFFIICFFYFFICLSSVPCAAQTIADMRNIEFIHPGQADLNYIQKNDNGKYTSISRVPDPRQDEVLKWEEYRSEIDSLRQLNGDYGNPIPVHDLRDITPDKFEKLFENKKYVLYQDSAKRTTLAKYGKYYFVVYSDELVEKETAGKNVSEWKIDRADFYNYHYVKTGNKYTIVLTERNEEYGYIIPLKDGLYIRSGLYYEIPPQIYNKSYPLTKKEKEEIVKNCSSERSLSCWIEDTEAGKELYNPMGRVLPQAYDEIRAEGYYFIAKKDDRYTVYNTRFDSLKLGNIRFADYYCYSRFIEVIADNKHLWIDHTGVTKKIHAVFEGRDVIPTGLKLVKYTINKNNGVISLVRNRDDIIGGTDYKPDTLVLKQDFDDIAFSNKKYIKGSVWADYLTGNPEESVDGYEDYDDYRNLKQEYIITEKDGKYGIAYVYSINEKNKAFSLNEYIQPLYDRIEEQRVYFDDKLMLFCKDKLFGIYPYMKEVRYSKQEKRAGRFLRLVLPSGKKVWFNTDDGKEYPDI